LSVLWFQEAQLYGLNHRALIRQKYTTITVGQNSFDTRL